MSAARSTMLLASLSASVLLALAPRPVSCLELGRLFYSPEERAAMDRHRYARPPVEAKVEAPPPVAAPVHVDAPGMVTLDGYVSRSSGLSTTWVNGVPRNDRLQLDPAGVRVDDGNHHSVDLHVGEAYDPQSGERHSVMQQDAKASVSVKP
jgi:hypothetical protein